MAVINLGTDFESLLAQSNRPAIPAGTFLALVVRVEEKLNAETGSYGLNWHLLVNTTPQDLKSPTGWDAEGTVVPLRYYTFLGYLRDGQLTDTAKAYSAANIMTALGFTKGVLDTEAVKLRQVLVQIKHSAGYNDPSRLWPEVVKAYQYRVGDEVAPRLAEFAEAIEERPQADAEPEF